MKFSLSTAQRKWAVPSFIGVLLTSFFLAAYFAKPPVIQRLSYLNADILQRQFPRPYNPDSPVRIIDIDEESIRKIGQWPWPRTIMAKLNDRLTDVGAAVIAYDIVFSEVDRTSPENLIPVLKSNPLARSEFQNIQTLKSHDEIFADSFKRSQVVAGMFLVNTDGNNIPEKRHGFAFSGTNPTARVGRYLGAISTIPVLEKAASGLGHVSFLPDTDGVIRSAPLFGRVDDQLFPSISIEALRVAQGASSFNIKSSNASGEMESESVELPEMAAVKVGAFEIPTTAKGDVIVHYSRSYPERYIPAWKILSDNPEDMDWSNRIAGHIVFIGTGAIGLKDMRTTPLEQAAPGVLVHAQIAEQVIEGDYLKRPYWGSMLEILSVLIYGLLISLLVPRLSAVRGIILFLFILNAAYISVLIAYSRYKYIIDPVYPMLAAVGTYLAVTLSSFYLTESERSRIRNAFSMYLSPDMVKQVSDNPESLTLGGEERELTILFLDVRGFSRLSEKMGPQDITTFLNKFLTPMTDILQKHNATIDKYIGDAIVAFWNAPLDDPNHIHNAALAILEMESALTELNNTHAGKDYVEWPGTVRIGMGINTGLCCVGNLGSEQRFSYSMIGDAANLASRIEGLTKQYGLTNLVGSSTVKDLEEFAIVEVDIVNVVGRESHEPIYAVIGDNDVAKSSEFLKFKSLHQSFLSNYRDQNWDEAQFIAKSILAMAHDYGFENYYSKMAVRMDGFKQNPLPTDWDGVFRATEK